jgi:SAM-dependent methyltransferase
MSNRPINDAWERGDPYEQYVGRWSRQVAPIFLSWLHIPPGKRWLDIGCGTGALCTAIIDICAPAAVSGIEPSKGFLKTAAAHLADRVMFAQGSAAAIPLKATTVDAVVSGLVLNFIPDHLAALAEMARVTVNGGTIGAYVWDYTDGMEFMRYFWDGAVALNPAAAGSDEALRFPICHPEALVELWSSAGFKAVEVTRIDIPTPFAHFEDYWQPFLGGQGPAPAYVAALDASAQIALRDHLQARIPVQDDGSLALIARAWAIRGTVAQ